MKNFFYSSALTFVLVLVLISMNGCQAMITAGGDTMEGESIATSDSVEDIERPEGWSAETHGNDTEPDYEVVFPQDKVNRIDIIISEENWEAMMADMTALMGTFGEGNRFGMQPGENFAGRPPLARQLPEGEMPENLPPGEGDPDFKIPEGALPEGNMPPAGEQPENFPWRGEQPEGEMQQPRGNFNQMPGGRNLDFTMENPIWVTATIEFEGDVWENVGIRFKGNSSLQHAWSTGSLKIPFKLDFDQFEDDYPEIENQRFYGFKQLSLANNFSDDSFLREKVTADIFRSFDVPSAHTAFYEVYVDSGEGPVYFGLYTMVEMVEDTVIKEQFASDEGNLYKPDGQGGTFAASSFTEESFDKETNQDDEDYSDIIALFDALHAENRLTDAVEWCEGLEAIFDVDTFLRWLAVNTIVQNWDTYGSMSHNYYLYTDPESGLITWIPWDNNMALSGSGMRGGVFSFSLEEVTEGWPLIRFLMDDPVFHSRYEAYLGEVIETAFNPQAMSETYRYYHDLIEPYVMAETEEATTLQSTASFADSVDGLIEHVNARYQAVKTYLSE